MNSVEMKSVAKELQSITVGAPTHFGGLTIFPLFRNGSKQNRALNLTILVPAKQVIVIPVSCVEPGRWHAESDTFQPTEHVMYSRARSAKGAQVSLSMADR